MKIAHDMTPADLARIVRETGLGQDSSGLWLVPNSDLIRFASLVRAAALEEARAQVEALRQDAARLDSRCIKLVLYDDIGELDKVIHVRNTDLRAAIDAAMPETVTPLPPGISSSTLTASEP